MGDIEESMYGVNKSCQILSDYIIKSPPPEKLFANWRLRYFVLYDNKRKINCGVCANNDGASREVTLKYFENESSYDSGDPPYGSIDIKFAQVRRMKEKVRGYRFAIGVSTPSRSYYLCFTNEFRFNKWFETLKELHHELWMDEHYITKDINDNTDTISEDSGFHSCHTDSNASSISSSTGKSISFAEDRPAPPPLPKKRLSSISRIKDRILSESCYSNSLQNLNTEDEKHEWTPTGNQPRRARSFDTGDSEQIQGQGLSTKPATIPRDMNSLRDFVNDLEKRRPSSPMSNVQIDMLSRFAQQIEANVNRTPSNEFIGPRAAASLSSSLQNLHTS